MDAPSSSAWGETSRDMDLDETMTESADWTHVTRQKRSPAKNEPQDASFYSCSNLPPSHPGRYVRASDVRAQVAQIPEYNHQIEGNSKDFKNLYPKNFANFEQFSALESCHPRIEYPLKLKGVQMWQASEGTATAGVHRVICDRDRGYRMGVDVVYHDTTKSSNPANNFTQANYHRPEAGEKGKQERHKNHRRGEGSASSGSSYY
ncbi:hypothetical protein MANI_029669 [Metarhizium anisopliae]